MIADNYTTFCSHIIHLGWFDIIELMFGPVGHTHNGNDATHNVHNTRAGNVNSVTLAEFCSHFVHAWQNPDTRPQPVVIESVCDWESYYPHINYIGGFTKTS